MIVTCYNKTWTDFLCGSSGGIYWDMKFNPSKCQVVRVTTSRKASNTSYILQNMVIWRLFPVQCTLGCYIQWPVMELPL